MKRHSEAGFTLAEVIVGAAIAAFVTLSLVALAQHYGQTAATLNAKVNARGDAGRLAERLSSEAASAWSVFVPPSDVLGAANSDGHELDFFAEDGAHRPYAWAYLYDARVRTLTRYAYARGSAARAEELFANFTSFRAQSADAAGVTDARSPVYDPLFATLAVPSVNFTFDAMPEAVGGNHLTRVSIAGDRILTETTLAAGTAPTTFTVLLTYTPAPVAQSPTPSPLPTYTP